MDIQSKKYGRMGDYVTEGYIVRNNLICKRPPVGYETKEERDDMARHGISDYQVFFKQFLIGEVYYQDTTRAWVYQSTEETGHNIIGCTNERGFSVQKLYETLREAEKCQSA